MVLLLPEIVTAYHIPIVSTSSLSLLQYYHLSSRRRSFGSATTWTTLSLSSVDNNNDNSENQQSSSSSGTNTKRNTDFEYQEMKVLLDALQREGIVTANRMDRTKANELNSYIQRIASDRTSTTSTASMAPPLPQVPALYNTSWTMKYTTMVGLPSDTTIQLQFLDAVPPSTRTATETDAMTTTTLRNMKYRLVFGTKTLGLNALNVDCNCVPYCVNNNNNNNMIQLALTFDTISMDAFGLENIPLCFLSHLLFRHDEQNPDLIIHTVYMDDNIWIEQQQQQQQVSPQQDNNDQTLLRSSNVIWNVYQKDATTSGVQ